MNTQVDSTKSAVNPLDLAKWEFYVLPTRYMNERFGDQKVTPLNFIPQGGGDVRAHHRCPGEGVAVAVMKVSVNFLVRLRYQVPSQDLRIDFQRLPAIPRSGFVIADVTPS